MQVPPKSNRWLFFLVSTIKTQNKYIYNLKHSLALAPIGTWPKSQSWQRCKKSWPSSTFDDHLRVSKLYLGLWSLSKVNYQYSGNLWLKSSYYEFYTKFEIWYAWLDCWVMIYLVCYCKEKWENVGYDNIFLWCWETPESEFLIFLFMSTLFIMWFGSFGRILGCDLCIVFVLFEENNQIRNPNFA